MDKEQLKQLLRAAQRMGVYTLPGMIDSIRAHEERGLDNWGKFPPVSGLICYLLAQCRDNQRTELVSRLAASGHWEAINEYQEVELIINCLEI